MDTENLVQKNVPWLQEQDPRAGESLSSYHDSRMDTSLV